MQSRRPRAIIPDTIGQTPAAILTKAPPPDKSRHYKEDQGRTAEHRTPDWPPRTENRQPRTEHVGQPPPAVESIDYRLPSTDNPSFIRRSCHCERSAAISRPQAATRNC